jgi:hypothetical protein
MADQIVITEKTSQAKDVRAAVGSRYGDILPAEGHLLDLLEPEDVVPEWKRWSPNLLRPEGLYGTRPADGGNKAAKLKAIREALRTAKRVWLATDCDREGQLIGQEILEHYKYRGQVMRVLFTAQDSKTKLASSSSSLPPPTPAGRPSSSPTSRPPVPTSSVCRPQSIMAYTSTCRPTTWRRPTNSAQADCRSSPFCRRSTDAGTAKTCRHIGPGPNDCPGTPPAGCASPSALPPTPM